MRKAIVVDPEDNVATLLKDVKKNELVQVKAGDKVTECKALEKIPFGHNIALSNIDKGQNVVKYGEVIGRASEDIVKGRHVHVHNVESLRGRGDLH